MSKVGKKIKQKLVKEEVNEHPTIYDNASNIGRLNSILDVLTSKRFTSIPLASASIRAAADLHGLLLPHLPVDGGDGDTTVSVHVPEHTEYVFKIVDSDHKQDRESGVPESEDWDDHLYLYIAIDREESDGLVDAFAQVVTKSELTSIVNMEPDDYPELDGDEAGETPEIKQTRHTMDD